MDDSAAALDGRVEHRNRLLLEISEALNGAETPEQAGAVITESALPIVGAIAGGVAVHEPAAPYLLGLRWAGMTAQIEQRFVRYPLDTLSPGAEAVRTHGIVWAPASEAVRRWPAVADTVALTGAGAVIGLPLAVLGESVGALVLHLTDARPLDSSTLQFLRTVAAMCAQAIARTRRHAAEHDVALSLQRMLLSPTAALSDVDVHVQYLPADPAFGIGGDWYDVIDTDSGLFLIVGDVEGHDAEAAAAMAQLSSAARALVLDGHPPAALLHRLDRYLATVTSHRSATALVVRIVDRTSALVGCAGHPYPLLRTDKISGWRDAVIAGGPPLGMGLPGVHWSETAIDLSDNWSLLMFTDGLLETGHDDIGTGYERLHATLATMPRSGTAADTARVALANAPPGTRTDDIAILSARYPATSTSSPASTVTP